MFANKRKVTKFSCTSNIRSLVVYLLVTFASLKVFFNLWGVTILLFLSSAWPCTRTVVLTTLSPLTCRAWTWLCTFSFFVLCFFFSHAQNKNQVKVTLFYITSSYWKWCNMVGNLVKHKLWSSVMVSFNAESSFLRLFTLFFSRFFACIALWYSLC